MIRAILPLAILATSACHYGDGPEATPSPPSGKCVADGLASLNRQDPHRRRRKAGDAALGRQNGPLDLARTWQ